MSCLESDAVGRNLVALAVSKLVKSGVCLFVCLCDCLYCIMLLMLNGDVFSYEWVFSQG